MRLLTAANIIRPTRRTRRTIRATKRPLITSRNPVSRPMAIRRHLNPRRAPIKNRQSISHKPPTKRQRLQYAQATQSNAKTARPTRQLRKIINSRQTPRRVPRHLLRNIAARIRSNDRVPRRPPTTSKRRLPRNHNQHVRILDIQTQRRILFTNERSHSRNIADARSTHTHPNRLTDNNRLVRLINLRANGPYKRRVILPRANHHSVANRPVSYASSNEQSTDEQNRTLPT